MSNLLIFQKPCELYGNCVKTKQTVHLHPCADASDRSLGALEPLRSVCLVGFCLHVYCLLNSGFQGLKAK